MSLRPSEHEHTVIVSRPPFRVVSCDTCTAQPYAVQQERHDAWGGRKSRELPWQTIWCEGDPYRATYIMERHYQNWAHPVATSGLAGGWTLRKRHSANET